MLGLTLLNGEGLSIAVLVAVFLSNLPEAMASTAGFVKAGASGLADHADLARGGRVERALVDARVSWSSVMPPQPRSRSCRGSSAGAILTMLADTMMPEAFEHGGAVAGLATTVGFALAFLIATVERGG